MFNTFWTYVRVIEEPVISSLVEKFNSSLAHARRIDLQPMTSCKLYIA